MDILDSDKSGSIASHVMSMIDMVKDNKYNQDSAWNIKHLDLLHVEEYIFNKIKDTPFELSYDVTAIEPLKFKTINYTTYAGCIVLNPLNFEQSLRQMYDAHAENLSSDYIGYIKQVIESTGTFSKYTFSKPTHAESRDVLVVLPGGNKLKKHCCVGKLQSILDRHGKENVLFKKHPVSYDGIYKELSDFLGGVEYAEADSDLFDLIKGSEYVYSTMISESALVASVLNKKLGHFDLLQNRQTGSFSHINYFLYSTENPLNWVDRTFASPKSGVIHPKIDKNWKTKVDDYFTYIQKLWHFYDDAYVIKD